MTNEWKTYRHAKSGLIQNLHPRVASADSNLIEVAEDAKPLAYTPIPKEAVESYFAAPVEDDSDEDESIAEPETEES